MVFLGFNIPCDWFVPFPNLNQCGEGFVVSCSKYIYNTLHFAGSLIWLLLPQYPIKSIHMCRFLFFLCLLFKCVSGLVEIAPFYGYVEYFLLCSAEIDSCYHICVDTHSALLACSDLFQMWRYCNFLHFSLLFLAPYVYSTCCCNCIGWLSMLGVVTILRNISIYGAFLHIMYFPCLQCR